MSGVEPDVAPWARAHGASFEVLPLVEIVKGRQVQVGFTISLHARLPLDREPGTERRKAAAEIQEGLRRIVQRLVPKEGSRARVEFDSSRAAVSFEPQGQMEPEIGLEARVFHGDDYFAEVTVGEEEKVRRVTRQLAEMGLKERRRRTP